MIKCDKCVDDPVCCDFCVFFDFNEDNQGAYTGNGWCWKHKTHEDPENLCDDFYCFEAPRSIILAIIVFFHKIFK
jgi:hypothetical protein